MVLNATEVLLVSMYTRKPNNLNNHIKTVHETKSSPLPKPNGVEAGTPDNPISTDNATEVSMYTQEPNNLNNHL